MNTGLPMPGTSLAALAAERPHETALICEREDGSVVALNRVELDRCASALAHRLADSAIGPGDFVAIDLPNGVEQVVATMAIWKLGACPMPAGDRDARQALATPKMVIREVPELSGMLRSGLRCGRGA